MFWMLEARVKIEVDVLFICEPWNEALPCQSNLLVWKKSQWDSGILCVNIDEVSYQNVLKHVSGLQLNLIPTG